MIKITKRKLRNIKLTNTTKKIESDQKHINVLMKGFDLIGVVARKYFPELELASVIEYSKRLALRIIRYKGLNRYIEIMKKTRNLTIKYLAGDPLIDRSFQTLTVDNIPVLLGNWIPLLRDKERGAIKIVLSILYMGRMIRKPVVPDYSTVQLAVRSIKLPSDALVESFVIKHNLKAESMVVKPFIRHSSGPMGPAMTSVLKEAKALPEDLIDSLNILLNNMEGGEDVIKVMKDIRQESTEEMHEGLDFASATKDTPIFRRIAQVPDKELKSRVVAIFDYWSQLALKPIHDSLADMLSTLPNDSMFDQHKLINDKTFNDLNGEIYYSWDLKACSDLLPIRLQTKLMECIYGKEFADAWTNVMVGYEFTTPWEVRSLKYTNGQPMGAYSSFPAFSLAHHLILHICSVRLGYDIQYYLLGDDIVIKGRESALMYEVLLEELGMEKQDTKSVISSQGWEFAKKLYINKIDYSHFPLSDLEKAGKCYWLISEVFRQQSWKGWDCDHINFKELSYEIFKALGIKHRKKLKYLSGKSYQFYNRINTEQPGWDDNLLWRIHKWYPEFRLNCTPKLEDIKRLFWEYSIHISVERVHKNIVESVKSLNKFMNGAPFKKWKADKNTYHPFIEVLSMCVKHLNNIQYGVVSNAQKSLQDYYPRKVNWADFTPLTPDTITNVTPSKGAVTKIIAHIGLNSDLKKLLRLIEQQRHELYSSELSTEEQDFISNSNEDNEQE